MIAWAVSIAFLILSLNTSKPVGVLVGYIIASIIFGILGAASDASSRNK